MPPLTFLQFYLDRGCVVIPCRPGTKSLVRGAGDWTLEDSRANVDKLGGNAALRNGTGGLLVVDVDSKHGGTTDLMTQRFPGSTPTRVIQTVSPGEHGLGLQLIYTLPEGFGIRPTVLVRNGEGSPMIEVAPFAMLPGSRARGADGVVRTYDILNDVLPQPAPPELLALIEARRVVGESQSVEISGDPKFTRAQLETRLARIADAGEGQRNDVFTQHALPVIRLCNALGEDPEAVLEAAYERSGGTDHRWLASAVRSAMKRSSEEPAGRLELGALARHRLNAMEVWARYAPWPGPSGPSDRRVFLALVDSCLDYGRTDTALGRRKLALKAGLSKETVDASLKRLQAAGRLSVANPDFSWGVVFAGV